MQWQPKETAPKDGTKFLAFTSFGEVEIGSWFEMYTDKYDEVDGGLYVKRREKFADGWDCNYFDWWMPLPAPPSEA